MLYLNGELLNTKSNKPDYDHQPLVEEYREWIKEAVNYYGPHLVVETRHRPYPDAKTGQPRFPGTRGLLLRTTLVDDDGNIEEWIYSPSTLRKVDGELQLEDPNLLIQKASFTVDITRNPDLVYYMMKCRKVGKTEDEGKKFHFRDIVARSLKNADKIRLESKVAYMIFTSIPERNLKTLAKSWGVPQVDVKHLDVVRDELLTRVEAGQKAKLAGSEGSRGYEEFIEASEVRFNDRVAALCSDAEEQGFLVYQAEERKWVIDYQDKGVPYILKELRGGEFGDPLGALVQFLVEEPDFLKKVENSMNRPLERPEGYEAPEEPKKEVPELEFATVMSTNNVMALKKMVKQHCPDAEVTKTMKAVDLKDILKAAIEQREPQE